MFLKNRSVYIGFSLGIALTLTIITILDSSCINYPKAYVVIENITQKSVTPSVADIVQCSDVPLEKRVKQRGNFLVLENYIMANKQFKCGDSITLTAPGDYRFLDNVVPLVERWKGPISIALYSPGYDFFTTLQCVAYLRNCATSLVREYVSFHLFFEYVHMPSKNGSALINIYKDTFDCSLKPPYVTKLDNETYKNSKKLTYPINIARNIAKTAAQTYFVFPSDIELYPTRNLIPKFLNIITKYPAYVAKDANKVFVVPIFEILADQKVPENKTQLQHMFNDKKAILFHQNVCSPCHKIPRQKEWLSANDSGGLDVFHIGKRQGEQKIWEPFFICTQKEPLWDERLNWEGQGNKMCQAFTLCMLNYDFAVLDNAFLIHKPGVKKKKVQVAKYWSEVKKNNNILVTIQKEMEYIYGLNNKCQIHNVFPKSKPAKKK